MKLKRIQTSVVLLCTLFSGVYAATNDTVSTNITPAPALELSEAVVAPSHVNKGESVVRNESWSSFLPIMAESAYEQGYDLPLPFGVGLNFVTLQRDIEVKELYAARKGRPLKDVTGLTSIDVENDIQTIVARMDVWIFPFLNVYAMGGYIENTSRVNFEATVPSLIGPDKTITVNEKTDLTGSVVGGGAMLAAGYRRYFLSLDANYTSTKLDGLVDESIDIWLYTVRTGWNGKIGPTPISLWVGAMYWDAERTLEGSVMSNGGGIAVDYEVLQGPVEPFNMTIGSAVELGRHTNLIFEYAFNLEDLQMLTMGASYRF